MTVIFRVLLEALIPAAVRWFHFVSEEASLFGCQSVLWKKKTVLIATVWGWACVSQRCGPAIGYRCSMFGFGWTASWKERMLFWMGHTGWMWLWCLGSDVLFFFSRKYDEPCGLWKPAQSNTLVFPQLPFLNLLTLSFFSHQSIPRLLKMRRLFKTVSLGVSGPRGSLCSGFLLLWDFCLLLPLHFHILNATVSTVFPLAQRSNVLLHLAKGWAKGILLKWSRNCPFLNFRTAQLHTQSVRYAVGIYASCLFRF